VGKCARGGKISGGGGLWANVFSKLLGGESFWGSPLFWRRAAEGGQQNTEGALFCNPHIFGGRPQLISGLKKPARGWGHICGEETTFFLQK